MNKYDINDKENYFKTFNCTIEIAFYKYTTLIEEFIQSVSTIVRYDYYKYILIKGIENIYHIFNILLLHSKNVDFTYHHTQRSYLYYLEFIEQIKNDNNIILNLNIKDATLFIYKKILSNINNNSVNTSSIEKNNLIILDKTISFYNNLLYNLIILYDASIIENTNKNIVKQIFKHSFNDIIKNIDIIKNCYDVIFTKITSIDKIIQLCKLINKYTKTHHFVNSINTIDINNINELSNNKIIKKLFKI